jgi:hypothetical protein
MNMEDGRGVRIPFCDEKLIFIKDTDGSEWVTVTSVCCSLGVDPNGQRSKVKKDIRFSVRTIFTLGLDGKRRRILCIPNCQLDLFVLSINPNKIVSKQTYIYFIQIEPRGPIKIRLSSNVELRKRTLDCALPYKTKVLGIVEAKIEQEKELHKRFKSHHIKGEWFRACHDITSYIKNVCRDNI